MTVHVLHAGDGYTYLTRQVASGDIARSAQDPLVAYYQAAGNPPGVWVGAGCADLGVSGQVTEEHMLALFGEGLRPDANEFIAARIAAGDTVDQAIAKARLGRKFYQYDNDIPLLAEIRTAYTAFEQTQHRRATVEERRRIKESVARSRLATLHPNGPAPSAEQVREYLTDELGRARQPVAGFDLTFSMIKSASLLAALGGHEIRRIVEEVDEDAWRAALAYGEREAGYTRLGANGIAFAKVSGFVAAAFRHRDSRAGDPDWHTHVVISNRVLAADGVWRTIDSRQLHRIAVSMSELYNTLVEKGLTDRLGVRFVDVPHGPGKRPVREIDGMPAEWIHGFSRRRTQVEAGYDQLVADYVARHGHSPPRSAQYKLAQEATLTNRPAKTELRTLAEQVQDWTRHAHDLLPGADIPATIHAVLHRGDAAVGPDLAQIAASVVERISEERSTWAVYHVRAEVQRQLRPFTAFFDDGDQLLDAVETITALALDRHSIQLDVDLEVDVLPRMLRHDDGESVFRRRGSTVYTCQAILDAEQRLVADAHHLRGPVVDDAVREAAILRWQQANPDKQLNPGQRALIAHFVSSGAALAVGIGPPGTGKSTTMAAMRAVWETTGGRVIGFAPSAAAASVLGDELGVRADTLHSLIVARRHGNPVDVRPGDLLLVDEAGMAGTRTLDEVRALAAERGAVVRLLGDYRQLTAVEAGGALRLIHHDAGGVELNEVHRFTRPEEAQAVLRLRVGDDRAVGFYADNDRLVGGVGPAVLDQLYRDWKTDVDAGRTSIMISDTTQVARELSARAQTERRAAGLVEPDGVRLHDGSIAGVGDHVVTRLNRRKLVLFGGLDFVKNGDLWQVERRFNDGRLLVRHLRHGGQVLLSADYVARFVELGYSATVHRAQGLTVDDSRAFLSTAATRELALVALSRGRDSNHAYFDVEQVLAVDEPPVLPGDLFYRHRETTIAEAALRTILQREGAELSATEQLRQALDEPHRMSTVVPQYVYGRQLHRGPLGQLQAKQWVRTGMPTYAEEILADEAWPELARLLHDVHDAGHDPARLLRTRAAQRPLHDDPHDPAESVAQVMHWRVASDLPIPTTDDDPDRPDLLPGWVATPPTPDEDTRMPGNLAEIVELGTWLRTRAQRIADRVRHLGERLADAPPAWANGLGPVPDDPVVREQWIRRAGQVAAYRERWQIPDTDTHLLPDGHGEQARARTWVAAYLRDHPLDNAAADAARRQAQQRGQFADHATRAADRQRREHDQHQRHVQMAQLLRETWRHEPELVEHIIAASAFDTVATRLHEAAEAGYDLNDVLAEIPLDSVAAPHIQDPAAYTAALIDIAVERIRSGQAGRDAARHAEQQRFTQMRDQAIDLVREAWHTRPELAETVITGPAFNALVNALDRYTDAGLDARDLLAAVPLAKLGSPTITNTSAFSVYLIHRGACRHLDALHQAQHAAHEAAERLARQRGAAAILRDAWREHPEQAEQVITGPAFRFLADRMLTAHQTGHDLHTVLGDLDPIALTAPHVPNPAGTTTFAFTRALNQRHPERPDHYRGEPAPHPLSTPTPVAANAPIGLPRERQTTTAHWSQRPHGRLTDATLRQRLEAAQQEVDRLARQRAAAQRQAAQLHQRADAGQGGHVRAVDDNLVRLREQARSIRDLDQLQAQWRQATERAADAAEQRGYAEHDLGQLGRRNHTRRTELTQRINQLHTAETTAHHVAARLAQRIANLQEQAGSREQRHRILARAQQAEADYPGARAIALDRDRAEAQHVVRHAEALAEREQHHGHQLNQIRTEHMLREHLPAAVREREEHERAIVQPASVTRELQPLGPQPAEPELAGPEAAHVSPPQLPSAPELDVDDLFPSLEPGDLEP